MRRATVGLLALVLIGAGGIVTYLWFINQSTPSLRLPGTVEIQEVRLSSRVGGRVESVLVEEGALVEPGQELVHFEIPELRAQRDQVQARLQAAQATLLKLERGARAQEKESARAAAAAAQARYERMQAGFRPQEKEEARHDVAAYQAELKFAHSELERERRLRSQVANSATDFDSVLASANKLEAQLRRAQARLDLVELGSRSEDIAEARAESTRWRAQADLLDAGTREEEIAEGQARVAELYGRLRELDSLIAEAIVLAPERAVVEVVAVRRGDVVPANQTVVRVLRADDLWVKAYVSEIDLGKVSLGQAVQVTIDSFPSKRFQGVVVQIASASEYTPRNIQSVDERRHQVFAIKVRVEDPQGIFKSGMAADVHLRLKEGS